MFDTLSEYLAFATENNGQLVQNINFIPNDGIDTEQIINSESIINNEFDYVVCFDNEEINSRWFVKECVRLRSAQYKLTLHRDVIADNYHNIENDPIFVRRAYLSNDDSMICNNEGMVFSQKLKNQTLLFQDNDNQPQNLIRRRPRQELGWIVGYVNSGTIANQVTYATQDSIEEYETSATLASKLGISEELLKNMFTYESTGVRNYVNCANSFYMTFGILGLRQLSSQEMHVPYGKTDGTVAEQMLASINGDFVRLTTGYNNIAYTEKYYSWNDTAVYHWQETAREYEEESGELIIVGDTKGKSIAFAYGLQTLPLDKVMNILNSSYEEGTTNQLQFLSAKNLNDIKNIKPNTIIYDGDTEKYYRANVEIIKGDSKKKHYTYGSNPALKEFFDNALSIGLANFDVREEIREEIWIETYEVSIKLSEVEAPNTKVPLSTSRRRCSGSVCDIFAIPFGGTRFANGSTIMDEHRSINDKNYLIGLASQIARQLGENCFDIQLLPYCPVPIAPRIGIHRETYYVCELSDLTEHVDYDFIKDGDDNPISFIYWFGNNNFNVNLDYKFEVQNRKIESQTDFIRICSPNGQGVFEMNVAKNNGLNGLKANCTYKPFTPFIQVIPNFDDQIYGYNVDKDYRGLICGGDFSLSRLDDKWVNYELNNKNFQNIFARDMESLELRQSQEKIKSTLAIPGAVVGGGVSGAALGAKAGPYGAIAGAVVGVGIGALTAGMNYDMQEALRQDAKDYAMDKYNYSLGNIQAMPETIAKLSAFNVASKIVPYIEEYTCTEQEREALENKIKYNSMVVERIGTLSEFRNQSFPKYFQGQFIMNADNNLHCDSHTMATIYDELAKGLYL